ncbi:Transcriptional regulator with HTH domain and aminotransferase domain [Paraburkholderia piptadeniae]|uniref:Transcriptional regulator with HTH domain and aminotransferase domain n=1 Tax=Paraburkholderia piptadeniae TaxID=1701573 RepID=A0A1N7SEZ5_9BURK|nr:PLP-dependent aminotransferase family protein [Paraburkholderia piptadeniae]SIT45966.1 Transcriptional regulator with HTH domain and aminotransferase domain [Paraburkholderia piptadeniae]
MTQPMARAAAPIHEQIYARFRSMIEQGQLSPGQKVSSLRALATELGVARGTVQVAYDRLLGEGYLVARGPAGTFVSEHTAPAKPAHAKKAPVAARPLSVPEAVIETEGGNPAPLQMGLPALDEFPRKLWARLTARQARKVGSLNKPPPAGYMPLREALAAYLHRSRGIDAHAAQVFVVPAYTASLALIVDALGLARESAWIEHPGYPPTAQTLKRMGLRVCNVPVDEHGLDVGFGRKRFKNARLAVVTPSHQSPTGVAMPLQRRVELLDWADAHDAWIVEDDYDGEYRYRGHPLPALKSMDACGRVIYFGSLSKVLFPGLRLSYVVVAPNLVPQFELACRRTVHGGCPELMQAVVADFIAEGHFSRHIKRMRTLYARRRAMLAESLAPYAADGFVVHLQDGGMHLLVDVREDLDDVVLASRARDAGFAVRALTTWRNGSPGRRGLLMGFTNINSQAQAQRLVTELFRAFGLRAR